MVNKAICKRFTIKFICIISKNPKNFPDWDSRRAFILLLTLHKIVPK